MHNSGITAPFKIRAARRGDANGLVSLLAEERLVSDAHTVTWIVSHPEMEILVAADSLDKVVGFATLAHRPALKAGGRAASIDELVVAKAWRRRGVGRELLRKAVERAKVLTVRRLEIQTFGPVTPELEVFLQASGFVNQPAGVFLFK
jgi:GNAT superfamily N-acetyltransferase